ncbi:methyltransferase [Rhodococcus sp. WMMA185]|uniref:methyltransferase n=1 Tax=Rhodococcus sp. WMMA185 TaxID=679318 RepID=UPI000A079AB8|nr:methyltransferase [Rhodococcus sp. WMMA185]
MRSHQGGGDDGFKRQFGSTPWKYSEQDRAFLETMNEATSNFSAESASREVLEAFGDYKLGNALIFDVGGGQGHLLRSIIKENPDAYGMVYERPEVLDLPELFWAEKMAVEERVEHLSGDMFESIPEADVYIMKHILHDWSDEQCITILENIGAAAQAGNRLFVADFVVPGPSERHFSKTFDLHMMCVTSGRERTEEEYGNMFEKSGWRYVTTRYPRSKRIGLMEAVKR